MKKLIKNIVVSIAVVTLSGAMSLTTLAGDPGLSGKNYVVSTKIINVPEITFTHIAENKSSIADEVSFSVSRTKKFTGSLSGSAEVDTVLYKCGKQAEISYGQESTSTTTCSWTIPPYSSMTCRYGSALVNTTGTMETWFNGVKKSSRPVSAKYTYASFSDKIPN